MKEWMLIAAKVLYVVATHISAQIARAAPFIICILVVFCLTGCASTGLQEAGNVCAGGYLQEYVNTNSAETVRVICK